MIAAASRCRHGLTTAGGGSTPTISPMIAPDVQAAVPLDGFVVRVVFTDGEVRDVDIEPLFQLPMFAPLRDREAFEAVFVDAESGTLAWPTGADLDRDVIYGTVDPEGTTRARVTTPQRA